MLAKRIIPCLDVAGGRVVKGKKFKNIQDVADPVKLAKRYNQAGADELVFYDITASNEGRDIFLDVVESVAAEIAIPFTVGGGIGTLEDIHRVLRAGADKVSLNSAAITNPSLIKESALKFGSQCIVLSIDAKQTEQYKWDVYLNGGRKHAKLDAVEWAKQGEALGAGEIVINAIHTDGEQLGYDLNLIQLIASSVSIPIVASGGAGSINDFLEVLKPGLADAALAASVFHYNDIPIPQLKKHLYNKGIEIRSERI